MKHFFGLILFALLCSCSPIRHLAENEYLLSKVEVQMLDTLHEDYRAVSLDNYIGQKPNTRFLGLFRLGLGLYNMSNLQSNSWGNRLLRRWGAPPVIYSAEETELSREALTAALFNRGYLRAQTEVLLDTIAPRELRLRYRPTLGELFYIGQSREYVQDSAVRALLHPTDTLNAKRNFPSNIYQTMLRRGNILSPERLGMEQQRISHILRNQGYWDFNEASVRFEIDTLKPRDSWVDMHIDSTYQPYRIGKVRILSNLSPQELSVGDSLSLGGVAIYSSPNHYLRPKVLRRRNWIEPGSLYSEELTARTYSDLADLSIVRSATVHYRVDSLAPVPTLDCDIQTTAEKTYELVADVVGTHSAGNLGVNSSVGLLHNNLFGGGEQFKLEYHIGYENLRGQSQDQFNQGVTTSINFPNLLTPWSMGRQQNLRGNTSLSLSYDYHRRPEFNRDLLSASWGYNWQSYTLPSLKHKLKLLEVDYMHFGYLSEQFSSSMPIITRLLHYRDQFVISASYQFNYSSKSDYRYSSLPYAHSLRLYLQSAGNLPYGLSSLLNAPQDKYGAYSVFKINFAQFVKAEVDYSFWRRIDAKNSLALHLGLNMVYPYGNSKILPIDIRYFSGGANSLRGWTARSLGPGAMKSRAQTNIFDQIGDIKLDMNVEYRSRLVNGFELALFADAGNIWTIRPYENQPDGDFRWDKFYKQIALSTGMGIRWDFDYFLLRLDMGIKLYAPQEEVGSRWVIGYKSASDLLAFHIALGYPF